MAKKKPKEITAVKNQETAYLDGPFPVEAGSKGALVAHIMQTMEISKHVDNANIDSLLCGLQEYLTLCAANNISVTNTGLYGALGLTSSTISDWASGKIRASDPRYKEFANLCRKLCGQYRELAAASGQLNPTLAIWWQKNYDGFSDTPAVVKIESGFDKPASPEDIAEKYKHLLTDDSGDRMEAERERRSVNAMPIVTEEEEE